MGQHCQEKDHSVEAAAAAGLDVADLRVAVAGLPELLARRNAIGAGK